MRIHIRDLGEARAVALAVLALAVGSGCKADAPSSPVVPPRVPVPAAPPGPGQKVLLENLRQPTGGIREAFALVQQGKASIPTLIEATADPQPRVRGLACFALGQLKVPSGEVVRALDARLDDADHEVRWSAARAFGDLRKVPAPIVARLEEKRKTDPDPTVRDGAEEALLTVTGAPASPLRSVDELLEVLAAGKPEERELAINAIGRLGLAKSRGVAEERVLKALVDRLLHDEHVPSRTNAALALWRIGDAPPFVVEALKNALEDPDFKVKSMAALMLGNFGPTSRQALPKLEAMAADKEFPELAKAARQAIGRIAARDGG